MQNNFIDSYQRCIEMLLKKNLIILLMNCISFNTWKDKDTPITIFNYSVKLYLQLYVDEYSFTQGLHVTIVV